MTLRIDPFPWGATWSDRVWKWLSNLRVVGNGLINAVSPTVSSDKGDAGATLTVGLSDTTQVWNTPLTADRAAALSTTDAVSGSKFRIVRTANATGAFNLNVGTGPLKALSIPGSSADVEFDGTSWILTNYSVFEPYV